ncbi:transmembrane channel-like protein 7 [Actinia tenebrosa]|uniref:Transmembrane channel-like protein 7 n=1 Tax=Actinia tenebrosa TaxID=6105 RepID=A0A6P8H7C6_ACTTE|nr:transmembrane channel-like protein 7 [Actinia tenebrosa]
MEAVEIEMVPLDEDEPPALPPKASSLMQELPSRMARHTTMSGITNSRRRGTLAIGATSALKRRAGRKMKSRALRRNQEMDTLNAIFDVHQPNIDDFDEDLLESVDFKAVPLPMAQRKRFRDSMKLHGMADVSRWKIFKNKMISNWKRFRSAGREILYSLGLWRGHLKEVEGQFGSGVVSYFSFLRWLVFLNLFIFLLEFGFVVIPTVAICSSDPPVNSTFNFTGCTYVKPKVVSNVTQTTNTANDILNFFIGEGWMRSTLIFYSNYPSELLISAEGFRYDLPLAYLLAGGAYFVFGFFLMITNLMSNLKESYIESEGVFNSYSNKVFAAWDYCIAENKSAEHRHKIIAQQIHYDISEQERKKRILLRTTKEKIALYTARILINLIVVPAVWYATFYVVFRAILFQETESTEKGNKSEVEQMLVRYGYDLLIALAITLPNLVLPLFFEFLAIFEDWSPDTELALDLLRRVFVKLPPLAVLMFLQYFKISEKVKKLKGHGKPACESCWENDISSQMYMLVWVDFVVVVITTLGVETLRKILFHRFRCFKKIGMQQFDIPRNVLDLVYGQCLILIGTFFSPLLPAMGVIKLAVLFYVKKVSLMYNNTLPERSYQGAKSNFTFTLLLLFGFFMCTAIVGWAVTNVPPSTCGPFNNVACDVSTSIFDKLSFEISSWPLLIDQAVYYMSTAAFILPVLIIFMVCLHYYWSVAKSHRRVIRLLKDHLAYEAKFRRALMMKLEQSNTERHDSAEHGVSEVTLEIAD